MILEQVSNNFLKKIDYQSCSIASMLALILIYQNVFFFYMFYSLTNVYCSQKGLYTYCIPLMSQPKQMPEILKLEEQNESV